jgi:DNA-binding transcriptional ArsR family regulator
MTAEKKFLRCDSEKPTRVGPITISFSPSNADIFKTVSATLKSLRALSDPTRLRIVALLERGELSVAELQEITRLGQSRISTHLGLLQESGLVESRREGKRAFYKLDEQADATAREFIQVAIRGAKELPEHSSDQINLKRVLHRRREQAEVYFNQIAGRFDRV